MTEEESWTNAEKKIARAAFDSAYTRECQAIADQVKQRINLPNNDPHVIWAIYDYLAERRKEIRLKYDFRYSLLILIFGRLLQEGWLSDKDLEGLSTEKLEAMHHYREI